MSDRDQKCDSYYDDMIVVSQRGSPIPQEEIDRCANLLGITRFPKGYAELMTRFGPGEFNHFLRMSTPDQIVSWREQNPTYRALDLGHSLDGDRFSFKPSRPDWIFVLPRHHSGILGAGWGVPKMLDWLATDNELNEWGSITEIYYTPYSEETCSYRVRQRDEAPIGTELEHAISQFIEPDHTIRRTSGQREQLNLFFPEYGAQIHYATSPSYTHLSIECDCEGADEFFERVLIALRARGFEGIYATRNLPETMKRHL